MQDFSPEKVVRNAKNLEQSNANTCISISYISMSIDTNIHNNYRLRKLHNLK